jgi:hypothetical protein
MRSLALLVAVGLATQCCSAFAVVNPIRNRALPIVRAPLGRAVTMGRSSQAYPARPKPSRAADAVPRKFVVKQPQSKLVVKAFSRRKSPVVATPSHEMRSLLWTTVPMPGLVRVLGGMIDGVRGCTLLVALLLRSSPEVRRFG